MTAPTEEDRLKGQEILIASDAVHVHGVAEAIASALAQARAEGAAEEREACAVRADELADIYRGYAEQMPSQREATVSATYRSFAFAIRARGETA